MAFSPDGKLRRDGQAVGYDHWTERHSLEGHTQPILSVAFRCDGETLANGSYDGTVRLWDAHTGQCLSALQPPRPYEGMNIAGVTGVTDAQKATLKALGAVIV